jgi:polyisoprenyl-teichoic acid--peptidoglycan teichoic acid transferase
VLPGGAQLAVGRRDVGRFAVRVWLGLVGLAVALGLLAWVDRGLVLGLVTRGWFLLGVSLALGAGAAAWAVLFVDAWRLGRPPLQSRGVRRATAATTAALVLLTAVPMLYLARQVSIGRSVLASLLGGNVVSSSSHGRYNVLLMGGDAGADRVGVRPDSLTLVSIDEDTGRPVLFSFPRNMQNVPFPDSSPMHSAFPHGFDCGDNCLLNAVYTYASTHKGLYGPEVKDPGAQATMDAVSGISGLKVNYYVLMDLQGFRDLVDALGGVVVDVRQPLPIGNHGGVLRPGRHRLDGYHALWYARSRHADSDYGRMARQRCVMTAMLDQLDPATVLTRFQRIALASKGVVKTSVPQADLGRFVDLALKAKSQKVTSVQFVPPLVVPMHPDFASIQARVRSTIQRSEQPPTPRATKQPSASATAGARPPATSSPSPVAPGRTRGDEVTTDAKSVCAAA